MKISLTIIFVALISLSAAQDRQYEPNKKHPYGQLNPNAPIPTGDFGKLIGSCKCKSVSRNPDGTWQDTLNMDWNFKYIMNGMAVQDEVWRENNMTAGSIRQYNADSAKWFVSYYTNASIPNTLPSWSGAKNESGDIVLFRGQPAPNGMDGHSRLTFTNISEDGFDWKGEWVSVDGSVTHPFWLIYCTKKKE